NSSESGSNGTSKEAFKGSESGTNIPDPKSGSANVALDHYNKGVDLLDSNDYSSAANEFRAALQAQSAYPEAQENLAVALYKSRRYQDAAKEAKKAIDLNGGKKYQTYDLLGRSLYDNRQYLEAAQAFVQSFSMNQKNGEALALSGFSLHLAGQKEAA